MGLTLQLNLTAVREIASQVASAAAAIAAEGFRLRMSAGSPAPDTTTLVLTGRLHEAALRLSYTAESAADELVRANEAILSYANNAAALARRTELAVMGLDVEDLALDFGVSARRPERPVQTPFVMALPVLDRDHRALGEAVLLSSGLAEPAHRAVADAHLRAVAGTLRHCARELRTAMDSGDRPAATLERFGSWLDDHFVPGLVELENSRRRWASAYSATRDQVRDTADSYRSGLAAAAAGGGSTDLAGVTGMAAHVRAALHEYARTPVVDVACAPHPHLGDR